MATEFEQQVYDLVSTIPVGKVATYGMLAEALGCGSAQAVGQALKRNPEAPRVPCHRIIRSDMSIGGYVGQTEGMMLCKKLQLLKSEGVNFDHHGKLVEHQRLMARTALWPAGSKNTGIRR